uniref:Uncharacterized protein n=1 Tax=Megaselia scalaris TaxID=36166 RepID=T1GZL0_MEGSC
MEHTEARYTSSTSIINKNKLLDDSLSEDSDPSNVSIVSKALKRTLLDKSHIEKYITTISFDRPYGVKFPLR